MDLKKYKKEIGFGLVIVAVICLMSVVLLKDDHKEAGEADDQQPVYIEVQTDKSCQKSEKNKEKQRIF